jgi:hypothetical protein
MVMNAIGKAKILCFYQHTTILNAAMFFCWSKESERYNTFPFNTNALTENLHPPLAVEAH